MPSHYYDPVALGDYLAKTRAEGLTPEFTNIPGAPGFQIGRGIRSPAEREEEDIPILDLPDIANFKTSEEATKAHFEISQQLEESIYQRRKEIEEEQRIPELQRQIEYYKATGLARTPFVAEKEAELVTRIQEVDKRLSLTSSGLSGIEADNYRASRKYLEQLAFQAKSLKSIESKGQLSDIETALARQGMNPQNLDTYARMTGQSTDTIAVKDIAFLNDDEKALIKEEEFTKGATPIDSVILLYPDSLGLFKKKVQNLVSKEDAAYINTQLDQLHTDTVKAKQKAIPAEWMDKDGKLLDPTSLNTRFTAAERKEQQKQASNSAAINTVERFKTRFRETNFKISSLNLDTISSLTDLEQGVMDLIKTPLKSYLAIVDTPGIAASTIRMNRANLIQILQDTIQQAQGREQITPPGISTAPSNIIPSVLISNILRKISLQAKDDFNSRYKDTLGIAVDLSMLPGGAF